MPKQYLKSAYPSPAASASPSSMPRPWSSRSSRAIRGSALLLRWGLALASSATVRAKHPPDATPNHVREICETLGLAHPIVTPGVAAAHALSGVAIFAGAASVLKTTPLYLPGSIVPNPTAAAIVPIATAALAIIPYPLREPRRRWIMLLILPQQCLLLMHFVSAIVAIMVGTLPRRICP